MKNKDKTKEQLINELAGLRQRIAELEKINAKCRRVEGSEGELLRELKSIFENIPFGIVYLDSEFRIISSNKFFDDFAGFQEGELNGKLCYEIVGEYSDDPTKKGLKKICSFCKKRECFKNKRPTIMERPLGDTIIRVTTIPELNEKGEIWRFMEIVEDITERKKAEEALKKAKDELEIRVKERTADLSSTVDLLKKEITHRNKIERALQESENRYRTVIEDQTEIICRFYPDGTYTFVNDVYCRFFGKAKEELIGRKWFPDAYPEDLEMIQATLSTMSPQNPVVVIENRVFSGDKVLRWMQFVNRGFYDQDGNLLEIQSVGRDLTERKKAEEQVKASLMEKEVLLQEIHHRVKNNMTINRMFMSYGLNSPKVALKTDVEDVAFVVDTAIPCGLIINELVSNSLKHAFPEDRDGEIKVSLRRNDKAEVELTVSDNGVGMPEDVDFRKTDSLGLNLVNALVVQLQGEIKLYREKGTEFIITFKRITV
jgi:PAS domain S-box-containing protein